eukprot:3141726-Prymnesium_polylepis.1
MEWQWGSAMFVERASVATPLPDVIRKCCTSYDLEKRLCKDTREAGGASVGGASSEEDSAESMT